MMGTAYLQKRVSEVDAQIAKLREYRGFLVNLQMHGIYPTVPEKDGKLTAKSEGKLVTLRCVIDLLSGGAPLPTKTIIQYLRNGVDDRRNEITLRSHLRRLRDEGHLRYNEQSKKWSLP